MNGYVNESVIIEHLGNILLRYLVQTAYTNSFSKCNLPVNMFVHLVWRKAVSTDYGNKLSCAIARFFINKTTVQFIRKTFAASHWSRVSMIKKNTIKPSNRLVSATCNSSPSPQVTQQLQRYNHACKCIGELRMRPYYLPFILPLQLVPQSVCGICVTV